MSGKDAFPRGHFYSPVVNPIELELRAKDIWDYKSDLLGVDFRHEAQAAFLSSLTPYVANFNFPSQPATPSSAQFYTDNDFFSGIDARVYHALLQLMRPQRVIEVGAGFSTLLLAEVNSKHLALTCETIAIDPFQTTITQQISGLSKLERIPVQDVSLGHFKRLCPGDILFIDSSHVSKTGSDVNFLLFEVLPRLAQGVYIHFHDIFLPHEYPKQWVLEQGRSWNEQYLLRALLMYSSAFQIEFSSSYALTHFREVLKNLFPGERMSGGSLWLKKTVEP